jgi:competence protein ComEA
VEPQTTPWRVFDASPAGTEGAEAGSPSQPPVGAHPMVLGPLRLAPAVWAALGLAVAALVGIAAVVVALGSGSAGALAVDGGHGLAGRSSPGPRSSGLASASGGELVVDVAGAVVRPGVYRLPSGSRVADAVSAAGGFGPRVAADRVSAELNLAALVTDGQHLFVPSRDEVAASRGPSGGGTGGGGGAAGSLVDINRATQAELEALPGIGPVTAQKVIAARTETPFKTVDELRERGLVGQKTFDALRALITVG